MTRLYEFFMRLVRPRVRNAITENAKELSALGERMEKERSNNRCGICTGPLFEKKYPRYGGDVFITYCECEYCGNETWPKSDA